jgi:hypothetical protein
MSCIIYKYCWGVSMHHAEEFAPWTMAPLAEAITSKSRRSLPPELVHAIDIERLSWVLHIKGLERDFAQAVPRARRLGVRFRQAPAEGVPGAVSAALGVNAALREIERLRPDPALLPREPALRRRVSTLERWFCEEVGPCVLWSLTQPFEARAQSRNQGDRAMAAPIARALDLIAGLTERHSYLSGDALSCADITAAAVLAPIARQEGWAWAGRLWTPIDHVAGRSVLTTHRGAAWVRALYARHGKCRTTNAEPARVWLP